jgi:alkanesulfonate monooxygenase SsuD/methylene tetrahydromethanopterin reductase-like flavin-dependent oxidoreductase (luciferase family)
MKYGFVVPPWPVNQIVDFAVEAEEAGWDGFFLSNVPWADDAWISLAGAAMRTSRIRLGTLLTPVSCFKPWRLAAETATLDHLSGGRVILSVGLGAPDTGFAAFGEATGRRQRAELVDEGLDIVTRLWAGERFAHHGKHYTIDTRKVPFMLTPPVQAPRIPIWIVGAWPRPRSMRRVARYDGLLPYVKPKGKPGRSADADDIREMRLWIEARRELATPLDVVIEGRTPGDDAGAGLEQVTPWSEAGATWWIESLWGEKAEETWWERMRQGPPPDPDIA